MYSPAGFRPETPFVGETTIICTDSFRLLDHREPHSPTRFNYTFRRINLFSIQIKAHICSCFHIKYISKVISNWNLLGCDTKARLSYLSKQRPRKTVEASDKSYSTDEHKNWSKSHRFAHKLYKKKLILNILAIELPKLMSMMNFVPWDTISTEMLIKDW